MFGRSRALADHIVAVASVLDDREECSRRARVAAEALGRKALRGARAYFWKPPEQPPELRGRFERLGEWMWMCQVAIFEIWFHLGEAALPDLRAVAFGEYDWVQARATDVLCRLALDGLETDRIAAEIARALPTWRDEQVQRVAPRVAELAARSEPLQDAYERLIDAYLDGDPVDALELLAPAARCSPDRVKRTYGERLRRLAEGIGLQGRTAFDDGHVVPTADGQALVAKSGPTYPRIADLHRIRAAIVLHVVEPADAANSRRLQEWAADHPDERVRAELHEILAGRSGPA